MSYHDPYAHGQYPQQQQYQDAPFNPYEVQQQQQQQPAARGYEQTGYGGGYVEPPLGATKEQPRSEFENDEPTPRVMGEKYVVLRLSTSAKC